VPVAVDKIDPEVQKGLDIIRDMSYAIATKDCELARKKYAEAIQFMKKHIPPHIRPEDILEYPPSESVLYYCSSDNIEERIVAYRRFQE
jgi:hypothetical protein